MNREETTPILIAGAGLSGLACARVLPPGGYQLVESESEPGGLCRSVERGGFTFDHSGHLLHATPAQAEAIAPLLPAGLRTIERRARVHLFDRTGDYPFQAHLGFLPPAQRDECLAGFEAVSGKAQDETSLATWCRSTFGGGITRHFLRPYNEKLYRVPLEQMSADWVNYIPRPDLAQVRAGAAGRPVSGVGYNATFRYPERGGIGALSRALASGLAISLDTALVGVESGARVAVLRTKTGAERRVRYERLVSTVPLPALVAMTADAPAEVRRAAASLSSVGVLCLNLGIDGPTTDAHWIYFAGPEYLFFRVGCYHNFTPCMAPAGKSSFYVEISCSDRSELPADYRARVGADLVKAGLIADARRIEVWHEAWIASAYAVPLLSRASAMAILTPWLEPVGILPLGRYGKWEYTAMAAALCEGQALGQRLAAGA